MTWLIDCKSGRRFATCRNPSSEHFTNSYVNSPPSFEASSAPSDPPPPIPPLPQPHPPNLSSAGRCNELVEQDRHADLRPREHNARYVTDGATGRISSKVNRRRSLRAGSVGSRAAMKGNLSRIESVLRPFSSVQAAYYSHTADFKSRARVCEAWL